MEDKKHFIQNMYFGLARRYDLVNHLISWGQDRRWRNRAVAGLPGDGWVADLGGGTGEMTKAYLRCCRPQGYVVLVDFNRAMLDQAKRKISRTPWCRQVHFVVGDVERLPFPPQVLSGGMSAFVLRNLPSIDGVASESLRVLRPGGKAVFLDATRPPMGLRRTLFDIYFQWVMPWLAGRLSRGHNQAYQYLARSVVEFPPAEEVARRFRKAGFARSEVIPLSGGMATIFRVSVDSMRA